MAILSSPYIMPRSSTLKTELCLRFIYLTNICGYADPFNCTRYSRSYSEDEIKKQLLFLSECLLCLIKLFETSLQNFKTVKPAIKLPILKSHVISLNNFQLLVNNFCWIKLNKVKYNGLTHVPLLFCQCA